MVLGLRVAEGIETWLLKLSCDRLLLLGPATPEFV